VRTLLFIKITKGDNPSLSIAVDHCSAKKVEGKKRMNITIVKIHPAERMVGEQLH
jgi:hypothetical protein